MTRSETARRKVLDASIELVHSEGVGAFTVESVAKRSGVAKTTIYRHWPSAEQLLVDTLRSTIEPIPTPNTGSLESDLAQILADLAPADGEDTDRQSRMLFGVLQRAADHDALRDAIDDLFRERLGPIRTTLELAQARGDITADVDLDLAVDLVIGPLLHRHLLRRRPVDHAETAQVIRHVVAGLRP